MARRKNVKRIDPRYFLNETVNRNDDGSALEEAGDRRHHKKFSGAVGQTRGAQEAARNAETKFGTARYFQDQELQDTIAGDKWRDRRQNESYEDQEELEEGCGDHEEAMAIDIEGPGVDLQVNDISDLPPEEAFVAGLEVAKDAIDQLMGGPEDLPPEGEGALQEFLKEDRGEHVQGVSNKIDRLRQAVKAAERGMENMEEGADMLSGDERTMALMDIRTHNAYWAKQQEVMNLNDKISLLLTQLQQLRQDDPGQLERGKG